jgi:hypothetical protein
VRHPQSLVFWICLQCEVGPGALLAGGPVIIGATLPQERFLTCVAQVSADELRDTPNSNERLTVVVLARTSEISGNARGLSCAQDKTCLLQLAGQANLSLCPYVRGF